MNGPRDSGTTDAPSIAAIDLRAFLAGTEQARRRIAKDVDDVCRSVGFLVIRNHDVPQRTLDDAWQAARDFFALPFEQKMRSRAEHPGNPRGYFPPQSESLAKTLDQDMPPDLKESFSSGPLTPPAGGEAMEDDDFFYGANLWPREPAGFTGAWIAYYRAMERLGGQVMQLFAAALGLEPNFFEPLHAHHISALRALSYPPSRGGLLAGQRPAGEHSDYGSVTILWPDPRIPGLEIRLPSGEWCAAPLIDDGLLVNIGDMMARWTNDRWVSTQHRVTSNDAAERRQSIAYFQNPNRDAEIRCIPTCLPDGASPEYPPVSAGAYLMGKFNATL